jgi:hypothetical protein
MVETGEIGREMISDPDKGGRIETRGEQKEEERSVDNGGDEAKSETGDRNSSGSSDGDNGITYSHSDVDSQAYEAATNEEEEEDDDAFFERLSNMVDVAGIAEKWQSGRCRFEVQVCDSGWALAAARQRQFDDSSSLTISLMAEGMCVGHCKDAKELK